MEEMWRELGVSTGKEKGKLKQLMGIKMGMAVLFVINFFSVCYLCL